MRLSRIWRILQIKEGVIQRGRRLRWITPSEIEICRVLHILRKPHSIIALLFIQNVSTFLKEFRHCALVFPLSKYNTTLSPGFLGQRFNNLQRVALLTLFWRHQFNNFRRAALLTSFIQYGEDSFQIGPLQDPVTWYRINYTGTQMTQWDFQNKGTLTSSARLSFVLKVPLRHLRPSVIYSVPRDRILQRAHLVKSSWLWWIMRVVLSNQKRENILNEYNNSSYTINHKCGNCMCDSESFLNKAMHHFLWASFGLKIACLRKTLHVHLR